MAPLSTIPCRSLRSASGGDLPLFSDLWTTTTMDSEKLSPVTLSSSSSYEDALFRAFVSPSLAVIMSLSPLYDSPAPDLQDPSLVNINLRNWLDYYKWRGLCSPDEESISNPLALLLHWPLTLYHIVAHKLPQIIIYPLTSCSKMAIT
ncbi:unnamed protein product [Schistosoma curassoni]|uniref:Uncharacterized protein n=1 Tax=Schistosoma curassoni TaxID=6186 RepID=A0A183KYL4_9TREM|nr:unnamed protein product [Schistosoma curassoni]